MRRSRLALPLVSAFLVTLATTSLPGAAFAKDQTHVVHKGQSLGKIARRYNAPVAVIREINGLEPGESLQPGQRLLIPDKSKHDYWLKRAKTRGAKDAKDAKSEKARRAEEKAEAAAEAKAEKARAKADKGKKGRDADAADAKSGKDAKAAKAKAAKAKGKEKDERGPRGDYSKRPKKAGWVKLVRGSEKFEGQLLAKGSRSKSAKLAPGALAALSKILRSNGGAKKDIDPRLAALIGMVSDHFGGRPLRVVSGYRPYTSGQYTRDSNHNHGRAIDLSVEGVPNTVLRDYCRKFRNAGVGYYPNSSFVHLDVRATKVYWVDYSAPGQAPKYTLDPSAPSDPAPPEEAHSHDETGSAPTPSAGLQEGDTKGGIPDTTGSEDKSPKKEGL